MSSHNLNIDPTTMKYLIRATINAEGVVEKPDVVGAIFGQTEGLLGDELDLRDLQKSGRIGRIEVIIDSKKGKSTGDVVLPSSLDKVETAILAAALESIDRVGPAKAEIVVTSVEDVRVAKRKQVIDRARELLAGLAESGKGESEQIADMVRDSMRIEDMVSFGAERLPAGPNVAKSDSIIIVEGRNDVANLLKHGIKNAIAVEGTSVPKTIVDLCKEKSAIAFVDGDRGGELILKELLQTAEVDFLARAPRATEVEELTQKQLMKALRNKVAAEQFVEMYSLDQGRARDVRDNVRGRDRGGERQERGQERGDRRGRDRGDRRGQPSEPVAIVEEDEDADVDVTTPIEGVDMSPSTQARRERGRGRERGERGERGERRGRGEQREERAPRQEREARPPRQEREERPPRQEREREEVPVRPKGERENKFLAILDELSGKLQAVLLTDDLEPIGDKVAVRDLADTLKKDTPNVTSVVFDGVVTQRLIDIALDKKIGTLVGVKTGNITKKPANVEIVTRADLA